MKAVKGVVDSRQQVYVPAGYLVQGMVVDAKSPTAILLLTKTTGDAHGLEEASLTQSVSQFIFLKDPQWGYYIRGGNNI